MGRLTRQREESSREMEAILGRLSESEDKCGRWGERASSAERELAGVTAERDFFKEKLLEAERYSTEL